MTNSSLGTGYLLPTQTQALPGSLSLRQFIQSVLVGISGLPGTSVRPKWQIAPPKQPDINTDWLAFGIRISTPDANAYINTNPDGSTESQRQEGLEIGCSFYGPDALDYAELVRDGFQITQNLAALTAANMGFTEVGPALHVPDLVNERWIDRYEMSVFLRRQVQRLYPIVSLVSATGVIHTVIGNEEYLLDWQTQS